MIPSPLIQLITDPAWDAPFFKRLAHNDTGKAAGHQGGVVIPKDLRPFFPSLDEALASATFPTVDRYLFADMHIGTEHVGRDTVRYQFQTWGGTRSAESRLTDKLGPIRSKASEGDLLVMQRSRDHLNAFRLILVEQHSPLFSEINALTSNDRWGILFNDQHPISQKDVSDAKTEMLAQAHGPFVPFRNDIPRVSKTRMAIARDLAFRSTLLSQYRRKCAVSGISLATYSSAEVDAAHIIPISLGGSDEPRNGFTLTGTLHWAFDRGLFGVGDDRKVTVPSKIRSMPENAWLVQFHNRQITEADSVELRTASEAFAWHRTHLVTQWL